MIFLRYFLLCVLCFSLVSCASNATLTTPFDPQEASFINQTGASTISGQGFLRTMVGEVRYAAGSEVFLIPATKYSTERIGQIYGNSKCAVFGKNFKNDDPRYKDFTKTTKANGEGRFSFTSLAAGDYFVVTSVYWQIPGNIFPEGCGIYELVRVGSGEKKEVIISGS
jgi:hypothetical protein